MGEDEESVLKTKKEKNEVQEGSARLNTVITKKGDKFYIESHPVRTWWKKPKVEIKEANKCPFCKKLLPVHSLIGEVVVFCRHCKNEVKLSVLPVSPGDSFDEDHGKICDEEF